MEAFSVKAEKNKGCFLRGQPFTCYRNATIYLCYRIAAA